MSKIEWCDETVNPLGYWCFGPNGTQTNPQPCEYCYARIIAKRKLRECELCHDFKTKHTHFEQLEKISKWKRPRDIFIQSMGDLFHADVPDEWIESVFEACKAAPQHRYLFLTKNPKRYEQFDRHMPGNMWFGWSQTKPWETDSFGTHHSWNTFVSIEPLLEEFTEFYPNTDWVIIGAESGKRKDKVVPKRAWIEQIVNACAAAKIPVFMKSSLADIWGEPLIQQLPWGAKP